MLGTCLNQHFILGGILGRELHFSTVAFSVSFYCHPRSWLLCYGHLAEFYLLFADSVSSFWSTKVLLTSFPDFPSGSALPCSWCPPSRRSALRPILGHLATAELLVSPSLWPQLCGGSLEKTSSHWIISCTHFQQRHRLPQFPHFAGELDGKLHTE